MGKSSAYWRNLVPICKHCGQPCYEMRGGELQNIHAHCANDIDRAVRAVSLDLVRAHLDVGMFERILPQTTNLFTISLLAEYAALWIDQYGE